MPKFRQRLIVEAFQWWPPGSPLHDAKNTPVLTAASAVEARAGRIFAVDARTGFDYVLADGRLHPLMPGEWIFPKAYQVWGNDAFEAAFEYVPEVPTPKNAEDERRDYVLLEKGLETSGAALVRALYVTGAILPVHVEHVKKWLYAHGLIDEEPVAFKPMMQAATSPLSE